MSARLVDVTSPRPRAGSATDPAAPEGLVVVLHGGGSRGAQVAVSPTQLSVLRMIPIARRLARAGRGRLAVVRLLNTHRGWDATHTPVQDAQWAIEQLVERYGERPVALVGHSLGGRAALLAGTAAPVRAVVALNPWVYATDDADLTGRRVLVVHGTADRIAPIERSREVAARLARRTDVSFVEVPGGKHAMLSQARAFEQAATDVVVETLLDPMGPTGPAGSAQG